MKRNTQLLIFLLIILFASPVQASGGDLVDFFLYAVFLLVYFIICLVLHIILILLCVYRNRNVLIAGLIVFNLTVFIVPWGLSSIVYEIAISPFKSFPLVTSLYILSFIVLTGIPLLQYMRAHPLEWSKQTRFKWIVLSQIILWCCLIIICFKPMISRKYYTYKRARTKIEREQRLEANIEKKRLLKKRRLEQKNKNRLYLKQKAEERIQKQKTEYYELLKNILDSDKMEILTLRRTTTKERVDLTRQGVLARGVGFYLGDELCETDQLEVINNLVNVLFKPAFYDFDHKGIINPFNRDSKDAVAILFYGHDSETQLTILFDIEQISVQHGSQVKAAKLTEVDTLRDLIKCKL